MRVLKRNGKYEDVSFDKVITRIRNIAMNCGGLDGIELDELAQKICSHIFDGVQTSELDELTGRLAASLITKHPDYGVLASRIVISNHQKNTMNSFSDKMMLLYHNTECISKEFYKNLKKYKNVIDKYIDYERDFSYDYFAFKTLERSYLLKIKTKIIERPQDMLMRVSLFLRGNNSIDEILECYDLLSKKYFIHATPTLFHSGSPKSQLLSCFLMGTQDSIKGIYKTISDCAQISKWAGGIGIHVSNIRGKNSLIRGTNGKSDGIIPMLKVYNETATYVNQSGKRAGSFAIYLEPWHCDVLEFLDLKKTHGDMGKRALDLFYAMWIPDLFMERVEKDEDWSLFSSDEAKNLTDVYGTEFEELYVKYEKEGIARKTIKARKVWNAILTAQIETGTPYLLCKDAANRKSNQKNLGTIKSSNLCAEILEYSDDKEYACCTLASIGLPKFVEDGKFNHEKLIKVVNMVVENLNIVVDKNFYPVPETRLSNQKHRPIGLGVQGLADTFIKLRYPFDSEEARQLNIEIFETIYYAALKKSCDIAKIEGPYSSFDGSPLSKGLFQFDLWDQELKEINYKREFKKTELTDRYNWEELRKEIQKHGVRNSLLLACMPTASTGQILGNTECIEPITSNIYTRGTNSGTFVVVNKYLINDLIERNLWNNEMKNKIIRNRGSIQKIEEIPKELRDLYKTSWDLKMKSLINMASDRAKFIDQTQSMNLFIENPTIRKLSSMYFYGYRKGLKTLVYYLRQKAPSFAQQFTVEPVVKGKEKFVEEIKEKREKESTFLQKVYLKEKNCEKTRQRAHSITQETDEDELRQVQELMGSMTKGPVCESCMG
jgi:ribonucleoside-diphosphate reductase alpha chain